MEVVPWSRPTQNRPLTWDDFMVHSVNRPLAKVRWEGGISPPLWAVLVLWGCPWPVGRGWSLAQWVQEVVLGGGRSLLLLSWRCMAPEGPCHMWAVWVHSFLWFLFILTLVVLAFCQKQKQRQKRRLGAKNSCPIKEIDRISLIYLNMGTSQLHIQFLPLDWIGNYIIESIITHCEDYHFKFDRSSEILKKSVCLFVFTSILHAY
jgi:hypothetical protein